MRRVLSIIMAWTFCVLMSAQEASVNSVVYNGKTIELQENVTSFSTLKSAGATSYVIMQFYKLPSKAERQTLLEKGIKLNEYLGNNSYLSELKASSLKSSSSAVRSIVSLNGIVKISEELQRGEIPKCAMKPNHSVELVISFFASVGDDQIKSDLEALEASELRISPFFERLTCVLPTKRLNDLNDLSWLKYAAPVAPEFETFDMQGNSQMGVSVLRGYAGADRSLTGKGINIGVWDGDVENHYDFQGRVTNREYEFHETSHGIHVSGIMAGAGIVDQKAIGVAPEAMMETWNFNVGDNEMTNGEEMYLSARDYGIDITQNSYGITHSGGFSWWYINNDVELDKVAYDFPNLLHVFAAGNSRGTYTYETVSHAAKNIVAVGAIDQYNRMTDFSSWGPVHDGRLVPHVCADGVDAWSCSYYNDYTDMSGTSQATPVVSGIAAQLYELYKTENGGISPQSSLIKAALCNTAHDLGAKGPDFSFGFGSVVASEAAKLIESKQFVVDELADGDENKISIFVPKGISAVKVMLAWTDPATAEYAENALVNDLDLKVDFKGQEYLPLILNPEAPFEVAKAGEDHLNNIEQVVIETPTAGYYDLYVKGKAIAVPNQEYALVYSFEEDNVNILSPVGGEIFETNSGVMVYWSAPDANKEAFTIQLSKDGGKTYSTIGTAKANERAYIWNTNDDAYGNAKIRVIAGKYFDASNAAFSLIGRPMIKGVDPEMSVSSLEWDAISGADAYNIYRLQDGEPVLLEQITATSYVLDNRNSDDDNWYAVSAVKTEGDIESLRSKAIKLRPVTNVAMFPFNEDFESEELNNFTLIQPENGQLAIGYNVDRKTKFLKFEGSVSGAVYSSSGTVDESWATNTSYIAKAKFKSVNTSGLSSLILSFDLKQTYCLSTNDNIFKVFVNGNLVSDVMGNDLFQPETPSYDNNKRRYFDLSSFIGSDIEVEFRGMCHYPTGVISGASQGDVIDIDNVKLYEKPSEDVAVLDVEFPWSGLNLKEEAISIKVANLGLESLSETDIKYTLYRNEEAVSTVQEKVTSPIESMSVGSYTFVAQADLSEEDSKYYVVVEAIGTNDVDQTNNSYQSYSSYNYGNIVPMAYNGTSGLKEVTEDGLVFTDGGTRVFNYPDETKSTYTFTPHDISKKVKISFTELSLEKDYDYIYLFSGKEATGTPMAILNGSLDDLEQTEFVSTDIYGQLTVYFMSDEAVNESGWVANISLAENTNAIDIGVAEITNPTPGKELSSSEMVGVMVSNYGTSEIQSYKVVYKVNDEEPVEMEFNSALRAGGSKYINFYKYEDFTQFGKEYKIEAHTVLEGDMVEYNNGNSVTIKSDYAAASGFGYGLHIENVTFEDINYSSGDNMYENHADLEASLEYGQTYILRVTKNDNIGSGKYWIDWNYDGIFTADETFLFDEAEGNTLMAEITPPNTAEPGVKRLRIRVATFGEMEPIGFTLSGEVEDYSINLVGTPPQVDVAIDGFDVQSMVDEGSAPVGVIVTNGSTSPQSFPVTLTIGEVYFGSKQVDDLAAGASTTVTFEDVVLENGFYELHAEASLSSDELLNNNSYSMQIEAKSITPVFAYSIIGSGAAASGPLKFNLENISQINQILEKNAFYPYCGTMAGDQWLIQSSGGTLSSIDQATGEITRIGASGYIIRDMAYDVKNKALYGRRMSDDYLPVSDVFSIDITTGRATLVGNISVPAIQTIACDVNGKMYGLDNTGMLYSVNKTTWEATEIGNIGILPGGSPHPTMFFDHNNGQLYTASCNMTLVSDDYEIRKINTATGASTLVKINNDFRRTLCYAVAYDENVAKGLAKLTAFNMAGSDMVGLINEETKTINLFVPIGANLNELPINFDLSPGATAKFAGASVVNGDVVDLIAHKKITVVSMDGESTVDYTIIIEDPINTEALLKSYNVADVNGAFDGYDVTAEIEASEDFKALEVTFEISDGAKAYVGNEMLVSGVTKLDHEKSFVLKVVAQDGVNTNFYVVTLSRNVNDEAEITYFLIEAALNPQLVSDLVGVIDGSSISIADVPFGVTNLIPSFEISAGAEIKKDDRFQTSGVDEVSFEDDVQYTVISEDGLQNSVYTISITNLTTDVQEIESGSFTVYPNPARDIVNMTNIEAGVVSIYNTLGGKLLSQEVFQANAVVELGNLAPGLYILKFNGESGESVCKIKLIP